MDVAGEMSRIGPFVLIRRILDAFRAVDVDMPLAQALVFIEVAIRQGSEPHLKTITDATGLPKSTASRYIGALSGRHYKKDPKSGLHLAGLGLLKLEMVAEDLRYRHIVLTPKGKALVRTLFSIVEVTDGRKPRQRHGKVQN